MGRPKPYNEIGLRVRLLREQLGVSGRELARRLGQQQSQVSRVESGQLFPSLALVERIADALCLSPFERSDLLAFYRIFVTEVVSAPSGRLAEQQERIQDLEQTTSCFRIFCPIAVPGLLQSPGYIRSIFSPSPAWPEEENESAILSRLRRQDILADPNRVFKFVVTEAGLRNRICSADRMREQVDYIKQRLASADGKITFRIVPLNAQVRELPVGAFNIYDEKLVLFDSYVNFIVFRQNEDIRRHLAVFESFQNVALEMNESLAYLDVILASHVRAGLSL